MPAAAAAAGDPCPIELFVECTGAGKPTPGPAPTRGDVAHRALTASGPHRANMPDAEIAGGAERSVGEPVMALAGETVVDPLWPAGLAGLGVCGAFVMLAQRRWRRELRGEPDMAGDPVAVEPESGLVVDLSSGDPRVERGVQHQLRVIDAWARTLDDRWAALSESERRIATQIIRRTAEDALGDLDLVST